MAFAPGPRNKAALVAANALTQAVPWAASTAYPLGTALTNGGNTYVVGISGYTSGATFSTTSLVLIAAAGATGAAGAAAPLFTGTITGDGAASSYTVTHSLNTFNLVGQLHDPNDSQAVVPQADILFPSLNTAQVILGSALANGVTLTLILH